MKIYKFVLYILSTLFIFKTTYCQENQETKNTRLTLNDSCSLIIEISKFDSSLNKIEKCEILNWIGVCLINDKLVFGTDFEIPYTTLNKMEIHCSDRFIELEVSCMFNPNGVSLVPNREQFEIIKAEGGFILIGNFSDGAGTYSAKWKIVANKSVRIFLGEN